MLRLPEFFVTCVLAAAPASTHSWFPKECCNLRDCYEIAADEVQQTPRGYKVKNTGQLIQNSEIRQSPDGKYYRCSRLGDRRYWTFCLFVPKPSV